MMRKIILTILPMFVVAGIFWGLQHYLGGGASISQGHYDRYFENAGQTVILYGTSDCPYCQRTREWLEKNKISYTDLDIRNSPKGKTDFATFDSPRYPVVITRTVKIIGFDQENLKVLVASTKPDSKIAK